MDSCNSILENDSEVKEDIPKMFLCVNETKHYPVSFPSYIHLLDFAEMDDNIKHPLGIVYKTKIANQDNRIRIVVLHSNRGEYGQLEAFIFDRVRWGSVKNPFTPEYHEPERKAIRGVIRAGRIIRGKIRGILS